MAKMFDVGDIVKISDNPKAALNKASRPGLGKVGKIIDAGVYQGFYNWYMVEVPGVGPCRIKNASNLEGPYPPSVLKTGKVPKSKYYGKFYVNHEYEVFKVVGGTNEKINVIKKTIYSGSSPYLSKGVVRPKKLEMMVEADPSVYEHTYTEHTKYLYTGPYKHFIKSIRDKLELATKLDLTEDQIIQSIINNQNHDKAFPIFGGALFIHCSLTKDTFDFWVTEDPSKRDHIWLRFSPKGKGSRGVYVFDDSEDVRRKIRFLQSGMGGMADVLGI